MGYFKDSLKELYEEFKVVFNQDEDKKFHRLFEEEYTVESMPNLVFVLIDLAKFLLNESKARENDLGEYNKQKEEEKTTYETCCKINVNDVGKRRARLVKELSTFQCIPLEVASKTLSFRSIQDCLKAEKIGNKFFLNSAVHHLDAFETIEVTIVASKMDLKIGEDITRKLITRKVTHLRFMEIISSELARKTVTNLVAVAKSYENIQTISFKGIFVDLLFESVYYGQDYTEAMLHFAKTCKKLKHILFDVF